MDSRDFGKQHDETAKDVRSRDSLLSVFIDTCHSSETIPTCTGLAADYAGRSNRFGFLGGSRSANCTDGRIEIFDPDGKFIAQWKHIRGLDFQPFSLAITKDDRLFVGDAVNGKIWILNALSGEVLEKVDDVAGLHGMALGPDEDIFVGSIVAGGVRRYSRR